MMSLFESLDLPPQLWIHSVFHSSLLEPSQDNTIPNRITPPPPPIELEDGPDMSLLTEESQRRVHL